MEREAGVLGGIPVAPPPDAAVWGRANNDGSGGRVARFRGTEAPVPAVMVVALVPLLLGIVGVVVAGKVEGEGHGTSLATASTSGVGDVFFFSTSCGGGSFGRVAPVVLEAFVCTLASLSHTSGEGPDRSVVIPVEMVGSILVLSSPSSSSLAFHDEASSWAASVEFTTASIGASPSLVMEIASFSLLSST